MMKFTRTKRDALSGQTEVAYDWNGFQIVASAKGVRFDGRSPDIFGQIELQLLAKTVGDAWGDHLLLKPNLMEGVPQLGH